MKKKIIAIMLSLAMCVGLSACGSGSDENSTGDRGANRKKTTEESKIQTESDIQEAETQEKTQEIAAVEELSGDLFGKKTDYADANVGDTIKFGHYEQDNDTANGDEEIEWLVLEKEEDKMLVISQYALDYQLYNTYEGPKMEKVTWETCTLRSWLNDNFYNAAFTEEEQAKIVTVTNENPDSDPFFSSEYYIEQRAKEYIDVYYPELYGAPGGNMTNDKVFCLSYEEAFNYFDSDEARKCMSTEYTKSLEEDPSSSGICNWWLRSPGDTEYDALYVRGGLRMDGFTGGSKKAVRPAMWISLN